MPCPNSYIAAVVMFAVVQGTATPHLHPTCAHLCYLHAMHLQANSCLPACACMLSLRLYEPGFTLIMCCTYQADQGFRPCFRYVWSLEWVIVDRSMSLSAVDATCGSHNRLTGTQALHTIISKVEKTNIYQDCSHVVCQNSLCTDRYTFSMGQIWHPTSGVMVSCGN